MSENPRQPFLKGIVLYLVIALFAAVASVGIYSGAILLYQRLHGETSAQSALDNPASAETKKDASSNGDAGTAQLRRTSESFRSVAKKVGPAVVNVKSTKGVPKKHANSMKGKRHHAQPPNPNDDEEEGPLPHDPFWDFFEHFGSPFQMPEPGPQTALGSGILVDKSGVVVTNNHVVEGGTEIMVRLASDKTDIKAKVIGTDPKTDIAVLKLEGAKDLPVAEWGDSDAVEVGDWAIAIGSPFALDQSVTVGIISAKGRSSVGLGSDFRGDLLQTDAAINPGNSGGPLCDLDGKVIGVNSAIYTRSGGYMGIGFAIPSNLAKDIVERLIKNGKIVRGWLGVYIQPLDPETAKDMGIKDGVGIHEVVESSPAAASGLQAGDVIIEVDGKQVKEPNELQRRIGDFKPGQTVKIKVVGYSDKKTRTATVKIGTLPEGEEVASATQSPEKDEEPDKIGVVAGTKGKDVVVKALEPGSLAETMLGLAVEDVIVRVNRENITSVAAYKKIINSAKHVNMEVRRKGRMLFFQFVLPD